MLWGNLADRFGRRPTLLATMVSIALGNLLFGFATNLVAALVVRCAILGAANGWTSLMALLCRDLGGEAHQATIFSYVISAGSIVAMAGPALGGFTYGLFGKAFPALPPSLIGTGLGLISCAATIAWLPETRPQQRQTATTTTTSATTERSNSHILLHTAGMPLAIGLRALHGMIAFAAFDIVPLWAVASIAGGGLALTQEEVGVLLAGAAVGQLVFTSLCMGPLANRLGMRKTFIVGCVVAGLAFVLLCLVPQPMQEGGEEMGSGFVAPAADSVRPPRAVSIALAATIYCVYMSALLLAGTGIVGVTSNLCAGYPERSGSLNGVIAMFEAMGKGTGPAVGAPIFAAAVSSRPAELYSPSGASLVLFATALLIILFGLAAIRLPNKVDGSVHGGRACESVQEPGTEATVELPTVPPTLPTAVRSAKAAKRFARLEEED